MMPLTAHTPKPLLEVKGKSLICHHLNRLAEQGFKDIVINVAYLGQQIIDQVGSGTELGLNIRYSDESNIGVLETAGGIRNALSLIRHEQFICLNADIWTDFNFMSLLNDTKTDKTHKRTIVLTANPQHNPDGDFCLDQDSMLIKNPDGTAKTSYTFSGIGLYSKNDFNNLSVKKQALAPILRTWAAQNELYGIVHNGIWYDIGTPERLDEINQLRIL